MESNVLVCSYHTDDDYYRGHAEELRTNLIDLGLDHEILEIAKVEGQDWADLCRQKVPFLNSVCEANPDRHIFWIDVDCRLLSFPDFVADSSADIIGFQRGFSKPTDIGYHKRGRFWEPCFWGVGTSTAARKMIADAAAAEARSTVKATDDYFFEEGWRANASDLTFQMIPSSLVAGKSLTPTGRDAFFSFGSSGNVDEFKGQVAQHEGIGKAPSLTWKKRVIKAGKFVVTRLPDKQAKQAIAAADRAGLTMVLTGQSELPKLGSTAERTPKQQRKYLSDVGLRAGFDGDVAAIEKAYDELCEFGVPMPDEVGTRDAALSFAHYAGGTGAELRLSWWVRPFPGNFGDWLSPLVVAAHTDRRVIFQSPTAPASKSKPHIISTGSIGRFIKSDSVVAGTGIADEEYSLDPRATYVSLRGPLTAAHLKSGGGPVVESFGDPGAILSRVLPIERGETNGRVALVRHFKHANFPLRTPENFDEFGVMMSSPEKIAELMHSLVRYDRVVTSAMHILIACESYGIPCALVVFEGFESAVPGTGLKYRDYSLGVDLGELSPSVVSLDLRSVNFDDITRHEPVSEAKKDEIVAAVERSVSLVEQKR